MNYKNKLLISKPVLYDNFFHRSVILIVEDNSSGTVGFALNKSLETNIHSYIAVLQSDINVYEGGPVSQNNIFYIHTRPDLISDSVLLYDKFYWSGRFEDVQKSVNENLILAHEIKFFLGYSGWEKGQLQEELNDNSWIVVNDTFLDLMLDFDEELWKKQLEKLGGEHLIWSNAPKDIMLN